MGIIKRLLKIILPVLILFALAVSAFIKTEMDSLTQTKQIEAYDNSITTSKANFYKVIGDKKIEEVKDKRKGKDDTKGIDTSSVSIAKEDFAGDKSKFIKDITIDNTKKLICQACFTLGYSKEYTSAILANVKRECSFDLGTVETVYGEYGKYGPKKKAFDRPFTRSEFDSQIYRGRYKGGVITYEGDGYWFYSYMDRKGRGNSKNRWFLGIGPIQYTGINHLKLKLTSKRFKADWYNPDFLLAYLFSKHYRNGKLNKLKNETFNSAGQAGYKLATAVVGVKKDSTTELSRRMKSAEDQYSYVKSVPEPDENFKKRFLKILEELNKIPEPSTNDAIKAFEKGELQFGAN